MPTSNKATLSQGKKHYVFMVRQVPNALSSCTLPAGSCILCGFTYSIYNMQGVIPGHILLHVGGYHQPMDSLFAVFLQC